MKVILLIFVIVSGSSTGGMGVASTQVEFSSVNMCETARSLVHMQNEKDMRTTGTMKGNTTYTAICIPSDGEVEELPAYVKRHIEAEKENN